MASTPRQRTPRGEVREHTPRKERKHGDRTPRAATPRQRTPRQRSRRRETPESIEKPSPPSAKSGTSSAVGLAATPRGKRRERTPRATEAGSQRRSRTPTEAGSERRSASARPFVSKYEDDYYSEDEWPVFSNVPKSTPNDLRRRIRVEPCDRYSPRKVGDMEEQKNACAGRYGRPQDGQQWMKTRMEKSYSARELKNQRLAAAGAIDPYGVLDPDWNGRSDATETLLQKQLRVRERGVEKENFVQGTKAIRSVPGYTGFVPSKKAEGIVGTSHEKTARIARAVAAEARSHRIEPSVCRLGKSSVPGYTGHIPLRRDETFALTHGEAARDAHKTFLDRHKDHAPAKPPKHAGHSVLPEGAWFGNAPHYALAGECSSTTKVCVRGARHEPGALAWDKPKPEPLNWQTGVVLRLR